MSRSIDYLVATADAIQLREADASLLFSRKCVSSDTSIEIIPSIGSVRKSVLQV